MTKACMADVRKKKIAAVVMMLCMAFMLFPQQAFAKGTYNVDVTISKPYAGEKPAFSVDYVVTDWSYEDRVAVDTTYNSNSYHEGIRWLRKSDGYYMSQTDVFEADKQYKLFIRLISPEEYEFSDETEILWADLIQTHESAYRLKSP